MATGNEADFEHIRQLLGVEIAGHAKTGLPENGLWAQLKRGGRQVGTLKFRRDADLDMHTTDMVRWLCQREGDLTDLGLGEGEEINLSAFHEQQWSFCAVERSGLLRLVQQAWEHNMARLRPPSPSSPEEDGSEGSEPGSDESGSESGSDGGYPKGELLVEFLGEMEAKTAAQRAALWIIARNIVFQLEIGDGELVWGMDSKPGKEVREGFLWEIKEAIGFENLQFLQEQQELAGHVEDGREVSWIDEGSRASFNDHTDDQRRVMLDLTLAAMWAVRQWKKDDFVDKGMACCSTRISDELKLGHLAVALSLQRHFGNKVNAKTGQKLMLGMCRDILFGALPGEGSGASGSGLGRGDPAGSSGGIAEGAPQWVTDLKNIAVDLRPDERKAIYLKCFSIVASTVLVHNGDTFSLQPEVPVEDHSRPWKWFYDLLKERMLDVFPGELSPAFSQGGGCLIKKVDVGAKGPTSVGEYKNPRTRWNVMTKQPAAGLLKGEDGTSLILDEGDPFFQYMAWPRAKKENEYYEQGALDWHFIVLATVSLFLEHERNISAILSSLINKKVAHNQGEQVGTPKKRGIMGKVLGFFGL